MDGSTLHYDPDVGGESSSSPVPVDKPVIVRVKRKASQSPPDALLLEISERPSKRPLVDFQKLSISSNSSTGKVDLIKRVLVQHVQTVDSSEAAMDILRSLAQPGGDNGTKVSSTANTLKNASKQHQLLEKAKQEQAALAKNARFEQIWRSRRGKGVAIHDEDLGEACRLFDIVRVDASGASAAGYKEPELSTEDQESLSAFLPLLREYIPAAIEDIEADIRSYVSAHGTAKMHPEGDEYVYDLYTVKEDVDETVTAHLYPLVQVNDDDEFYDGPDNSDYESDDSNAENHPLNDYPDEESGSEDEDKEASGNESEEPKSEKHSSKESSMADDDSEDRDDFSLWKDPLEEDGYNDYDNFVDGFSDEDDDEDQRWLT
ncbi:RNA-directed DNA methylation 4-like protein [Drosera capensis]